MNTCVVHNDHRIRARERVHDIQKSVDKTIELLGCIWMIFHSEVQDAIKGKCGKDGVPLRPLEQKMQR